MRSLSLARTGVCALVCAGLPSSMTTIAQDTVLSSTFEAAVNAVTDRATLEAWLQVNAPGLTTYVVPPAPSGTSPSAGAPALRPVEISRTTYRRYSWSQCRLIVQESEAQGVALEPIALTTTADVNLADVDSVGSVQVLDGEGAVGLELVPHAPKSGNIRGGRSVKLLTRQPRLVRSVVMKYVEVCKGNFIEK